jgi:hypothetical protein
MTKKQMQDRITELEAMVASLTTALAMAHPIYVVPSPPFVSPTIQPIIRPCPYTPYIVDPLPNWGTVTCGKLGQATNV